MKYRIEHSLAMYNKLDAYLMANKETITVAEALLIKQQMDRLYTVMTTVPKRAEK